MFKESAQILSTFEESANDHINKLCEFNTLEGNASLQVSLELAAELFI